LWYHIELLRPVGNSLIIVALLLEDDHRRELLIPTALPRLDRLLLLSPHYGCLVLVVRLDYSVVAR
jgi:hypothetical protein